MSIRLGRVFKWGVVGVGASTAFTGFYSRFKTNQLCKETLEKIAKHEKEPIYEVYGPEAQAYPWNDQSLKSNEDWEFRKVRLFGTFGPSFSFVRRERNNEPGYLVFMPFYTAHEENPNVVNFTIDGSMIGSTNYGVMVCIGWVSKEKGVKVSERLLHPVKPINVDENAQFTPFDTFTGLTVENGELVNYFGFDPSNTKISCIEGFVRKGEEKDFFRGIWSDDDTKQQNQINLPRMLRNINLANKNISNYWYIDRAVDRIDNKTGDILPQSFENTYKYYEDLTKNNQLYNNSKKIGWLGTAALCLSIFI